MARTTTAPSTQSDTTTPQSAPVSVLQHLDPATLLVDRNLRHDPRLDPAFLASVKDQGVLVPIVVVRTAAAQIRVRFGHRRTLAAIAGGVPTVPVVIAADEGTDDAAQVARLVAQWAENEHRTGLSTAERVDVTAQLAAFGVSAAQIAKRTRTPRAAVDAALAVAGCDLAKAATVRYEFLDLAQAAIVADFADDTEAVKALVVAAKNGQFDHTAQRLRDDRAEARRRTAVATELREAGVRVIEVPTTKDRAKNLAQLRAAVDGPELDETNHRECPGHGAYIANLYGCIDPTTGAPVDQDDDEDLDDDPEDADRDSSGTRPEWGHYLGVRYVCTDPTTYGHVDRYNPRPGGTGQCKAAGMTDAERETARAERRDVIGSNKAWASAEKVRRAWLRTFAARKTAPKGAAAFVATAIALDAEIVAGLSGNTLAADLLSCPDTGHGRNTNLAELAHQATEARAQVLVLVQVLAAYEARTDRDDWRHHRAHTARYLDYLTACGYTLSEVEARARGDRDTVAAG
jgi:ParB family chromosome partitioning protein